MYSRKPLNQNSRTHGKLQVSHDAFTNRRGTLTYGQPKEEENKNNGINSKFPSIHRRPTKDFKTTLVSESPLTSIKDQIKNKITQLQSTSDESEALENSPYKKRENRTTLPNVNKFTDKHTGSYETKESSNNVLNITPMAKDGKDGNVSKPNSKQGIKKITHSNNNIVSKHQHNHSHNNINNTGVQSNAVNLKSDYSPIIKYSNNNMNLLMKMTHENHKDFNLNPHHNHSSNSTNFNALNSHVQEQEKLKVKIKTAHKSKAGNNGGKTKTNQDSYLVKLGGMKLEGFNLFAVMDGHGSHGHFISNSVKALFSEYIFKSSHYGLNISSGNTSGNPLGSSHKSHYNQQSSSNNGQNSINLGYLSTIYSKIVQNDYNLVKRCFQHCEATLAKSKYEVNFSGTTAIMVIQLDDILICGNAGDSRAVVKTTEGVKPLSLDHKPDNEEEKRRIIAAGGRVEKFNDCGEFIGPYRVWLKYEDYPGLAMSRSLGDFVSKSVGCSCIPEVIELKIQSNYEFMVLASDGVWEFLDNETVCKLVQPYYNKNDPDGAVNKLIEEASRMWKIEDDGQDDITAVVVFFSPNQ